MTLRGTAVATEERCLTRLLADTPSETDSFGSHERVARAIGEVVQTESGGRAIGLEGGWGAGKSTIVGLTAKELAQTKDCDHRIAVFDIWAHQDDPLRRTFLENLITRVQGFGWVNKDQWDRRLSELTTRRREETTRVIPKLTGAGIWFALTLLSIPVGAALISAGATLWASDNPSEKLAAALLLVGLIGVLAPAIFYAFVVAFPQWRRKSRAIGRSDDGGLSDFPALVTGQASTESRTIVTQTPDPTSVEFEAVFRELLGEALVPKNRKLLLVVDNLDRVQPSDALSIWSTLQTFLGYSDYRQADWIDRLWVLIPYDGDAILRLWDQSDSNNTEATNPTLAASFLDKTFQLRFRVPPLLLTNWREFLQDALQQALPNHREEDFHDVYRAFAAEGGLETSAPTPRDLKIFVNQIGTLHRTWQDEFALSHLACYVLLQKGSESIRDVLLAKDDLDFPRRIIGDQWREIISALHFGVSSQEASQLLLRGPIEVALADGDGAALSELASVHPSGFWSVLEDTVPAGSQDWSDVAPAELAKAAIALENSGVLELTDNRPEATAVRSSIQIAAAGVQAWNPFNVANANGMVAIVKLVGDSEKTIPALLMGASNTVVGNPGGAEQEGDSGAARERVTARAWMAAALTLIEGLVELGLDQHLGTGFEVPLSAEQWLEVSREVAGKDPDGRLLQYFDLQAIVELDQLLAEQIADDQIEGNTFSAVRAAMMTTSQNGLNNTANSVFARLQPEESIQPAYLHFMLRTLRISEAAGLIPRDQYAEFAASGNYLHHLHQAVSESHIEAVGECMFGFLRAVPDPEQPAQVGNSHAGYQYLTQMLQTPDMVTGAAEHFAALVRETQQLPVVFEMATAWETVPPFLANVLRTLLRSEDVCKPVELVRANWDVIREVLREEDSQDFETFLKELPGRDSLVDGVVDGAFDVGESGLYVALLKGVGDRRLVNWCAAHLSSVDQDTWSRAMASQGDLLDLVIESKARRADVTLGVAFLDALIEYARTVAAGLSSVLPDVYWRELVSLLSADQQELLSRRAYDILVASDGEASTEFIKILGGLLSSTNLLSNDRRFIDQVCRPILVKGNASGIEWVADIADSDPRLFTRHRDRAAANDFKERVQQSLNEAVDDDPTLLNLKRIGDALGIERQDAEPASEGQSEDLSEATE